MKKHDLTRIIITVAALILTGVLMLLAARSGRRFFAIYTPFSLALEGVLAGITGIVPFSVFELLCVVGLAAAIVNLALAIKRKRVVKWFTAIAMTAALLLFGFTFSWGLNHFGPTITEALGMDIRRYSVDELEETARYMMDQAGLAAELLPADADGVTVFSDFKTLAKEANDGYRILEAEGLSFFGGSDAPPKPLASGKLFSYMGTTGIYIFLTGEANVNPDAYAAAIPFTMCHELAHRRSFAHEEDANFCAFLACRASKNPEFNYSGFYEAFIYCYNSLYEASHDRALALWQDASPRLYADILATNAHYHKYDGKVKDAAQSVNDVYLKAYGENEGVRSYGAVTDALIAWYLAQ